MSPWMTLILDQRNVELVSGAEQKTVKSTACFFKLTQADSTQIERFLSNKIKTIPAQTEKPIAMKYLENVCLLAKQIVE